MIPAPRVLRVLDLFSGTGSITRAFLNSGHEVISLDMDPRGAPTICANILDWQFKTLPRGHFTLVWASCPCEEYSVARSNASTPRYHSRDELHRIPEGLCMDVVAFAAGGGAEEIE